jgi:hypothetical protein
MILTLAAIIAVIGSVSAQEVPAGVTQLIEVLKKDSSIAWGFCDAKRSFGLDKKVGFSDMKIGVPLEEYCLRDSFESLPDSLPVKSQIQPVGRWLIPVLAKGRYIYLLRVSNNHGSWEFVGMDEVWHGWQEFRATWPESQTKGAILINYGPVLYLHLPQKGNHNLIYISLNKAFDLRSGTASKKPAALVDSREIFRYLKEDMKRRRMEMSELRKKNPNAR